MSETFHRPCLWCIRDHSDQPPNMVAVGAEKSDGICARCADEWKEQIRARRAAMEAAK